MTRRTIATLFATSALLLSACAGATTEGAAPTAGAGGLYARPIGDAPVTANPTPYSAALVCLGSYARQNNLPAPRIAVGRISDYTGKEGREGSGAKLTQGASLMAISALAKAGAPLVERYDTAVSELELKYANDKLLTDGASPGAPGVDPAPDYRRIHAGQMPGSDFYIVGGLTELNYDIRSSGRGRQFVMNVGLDLRLVNTRSLEVVDVISYQKQIIGREVGAGVFDVMDGNLFDISAREGAVEPVQLAVRALVERAVLEMMANLYGVPGPRACLAADPLAGGAIGVTGGFTPAYENSGVNNATRSDPDAWTDRRDETRRGRY